MLRRHGYTAEKGCAGGELCPALSLPDLFRTPALSATREQIRALLDAVPPYFSQAAITPDRKTAVLAFGIRLQSLEAQREVMQDMRARLHPPKGVTATLAGLPVLAADANHALSDPLRRMLTALAGLLAVLLALFAVYRSWARAWVPLVPIALATGWSALVLWLIGVPLNPMSAALSALVIAISTEFSVLLCARYREEREAGFEPGEALARTYASTGAAVLASGVTAIAGFAVLIASDIAMLRDFGLVTVIDLAVSLLGVLAVLPAVLVLAERRAEAGRAPAAAVAPSRHERRANAAAGFAGAMRDRCMGKPMKRPGLLLAVFVVALLGWITFNSVATETAGSEGLQAGDPLPPFAMPLSTSACRGRCDANVATEAGQGAAGAKPACAVRGPEVLNSCELAEGGPFVLAFVFEPVARCRDQLPVLERVAARHPEVEFRVVAVRADALTARALRSKLPVGYDHDGAVANEYAVVVCPTITYVRSGGKVAGSSVGPLAEEALEGWVKRIESLSPRSRSRRPIRRCPASGSSGARSRSRATRCGDRSPALRRRLHALLGPAQRRAGDHPGHA